MKAAILGAVAAALVFVGSALAFDREPVRVTQLHPDGWGNTTVGAAKDVRHRFGGTGGIYCVGVIMVGHEKDSSWVHGMTRFWDKEMCAAARNGGGFVTFIYDAKGSGVESFQVYRVKQYAK